MLIKTFRWLLLALTCTSITMTALRGETLLPQSINPSRPVIAPSPNGTVRCCYFLDDGEVPWSICSDEW